MGADVTLQRDLPAPSAAGAALAERFDEIVERHGPRIARLVQRLLGWPSEVEDVVQDVFAAAWARRESFRGEAEVGTWLMRIAVNVCRTRQRRRYRWLRWWEGAAAGVSPAAATDEPDAELRRAVRAAIAELPTAHREVVVLRYLEGREPREITEIVGVRKNTVEARLSRARKALRARLGAADGMES